MIISPALLAEQSEIRSISQPVAPLHPLRMLTARRFLHCTIADGARAIPVGSLDVIVLLNAERRTAFAAAILENLAPAARFHAFAKAVYAHPPADFRLVSSFRHISLSPKKRGPNSPRDV